MKLALANGVTSVVLRVKISDIDSDDPNAGLTGLTHESTGLAISTLADNEATPTVYTSAAGKIETIATLGTFAAPTEGKCRFREVDATNHPGLYEIQLANSRWAVSGARSVIVTVSGAAGAGQTDAEIQLDAQVDASSLLDLADGVEAGFSLRKVLRIIAAVLAGKVSGAGSGLETFRSLDDAVDRVEIAVDPAGNRTAVTYAAE